MPGFYETYLHGLQNAVPYARLQETERQNQAMMLYRLRALQGQEMMRMENQRRLNEALEETRRHHSSTENIALRNLVTRMQQQLIAQGQGNFDLKEDSAGNLWAFDKRSNTISPVGGGKGGQVPSGASLPSEGFKAPKALPSTERTNLGKIAEDYQALVALAKSFKPEFAGSITPGIGRLANVVGAYGPEMTGLGPQAEWWRQQEALQNIPQRHAAFGGSVTRTETPLWERGTINPAMRPEDVIKMLNVRAALLGRALQRRGRSASKSYNRKEVESAIGLPLDKNEPALGMPSLEDLAIEGSRTTGIGRPPLEQLLQDQ